MNTINLGVNFNVKMYTPHLIMRMYTFCNYKFPLFCFPYHRFDKGIENQTKKYHMNVSDTDARTPSHSHTILL